MISRIEKWIRELSDSLSVSGIPQTDHLNYNNPERLITILNFICIFMIVFLSFYGIFSVLNGVYHRGIINLIISVIIFSLILYLKRSRNYKFVVKMIIFASMLFAMYLFQTEVNGDGLYLWILTAPLFLIFFLKLKNGLILSLSYLAINLLLTSLNIFNAKYSFRFLIRFAGVYTTLVIMSFVFRKLQEETTKGLVNTNIKLSKTIERLSLAEEELIKSEEQYRALVENSNDGIGILKDFRFIYVNTKLSNMSGFEKNELLNKSLDQIVISENKQLLRKLFNKETWSGLPRERVELNLQTKSGNQIEIDVGTNTVEYEQAESQLIFIKDVRERNLIEKEKSKISNLESFRMVANGVTHDFNNILTIILGNLELIRLGGKDIPKFEKPIGKIEEASARASDLLDDLYIFSTSSVKEESIELMSEIIDSVLYTLRAEFSSTEVIWNSRDDLLKLRCDRKQVSIALKNILLNSIDAAEGKSKIEISITGFSNLANIVQPLKRGNFVKISIKDSGKGIPVENIGKIFDPYFSTKGNVTEKGMGLGLAIANKIILDHMGLITVTSKDRKGTTFIIYLPVEADTTLNR